MKIAKFILLVSSSFFLVGCLSKPPESRNSKIPAYDLPQELRLKMWKLEASE